MRVDHKSRNQVAKELEILPEIFELARDTLPQDKMKEAVVIAEMIYGAKREREYAKAKLRLLAKPPLSRPLYYLMQEIAGLPRTTRNCIRYLGDYIDLLTKEMTFEFVGGNARRTSLGRNARRLVEKAPNIKDLAYKLQWFSDFIYTPGKHDFSLPPGRSHSFTLKEVVLATYVAVELAERIKSISKFAREAVEKDNLYIIGGRWGSSSRVRCVGERSSETSD